MDFYSRVSMYSIDKDLSLFSYILALGSAWLGSVWPRSAILEDQTFHFSKFKYSLALSGTMLGSFPSQCHLKTTTEQKRGII